MRIDFITLFPEMCDAAMGASIIGRAREKGAVELVFHQLRDYCINNHGQVDDTPYGGGEGMLMLCQPIYDCFTEICRQTGTRPHFIYLSPSGKTLSQERVKELSADYDHIALLCGRYEGVDQRVLDELVDEEISIGDYVVTGGELPALILADAVCRMMPGVLKNPQGFMEESHYNGILEYPQYTKPPVWHGKEVPEVLTNGHHAKIVEWQRLHALERTYRRRPELLENTQLSVKEKLFLAEIRDRESRGDGKEEVTD